MERKLPGYKELASTVQARVKKEPMKKLQRLKEMYHFKITLNNVVLNDGAHFDNGSISYIFGTFSSKSLLWETELYVLIFKHDVYRNG